MIVATKKTHEDFSLSKAFSYWVSNSPSMVRVCGILKFIHGLDVCNGWESEYRKNIWQNRRNLTIEFKQEWRLRSIEERKAKVIEWCKFGSEDDQMRHKWRLSKFYKNRGASESHSEWIEKSKESKKIREKYTKNLWASWEAWSHCEHPPQIMSWDTIRPQPQDRRNYISKWYEGIHPGRFFLFYRENEIVQDRNKGVPSGPCEDGYRYPRTPIFDRGPYEQLIEDLLVLDGPGIGESAGSKIEHIDDLFLND
jgi:hypothetical protein